jgi:hypothetical protein
MPINMSAHTERPGDEGDGDRCERGERAGELRHLWKELRSEHDRGGRAVDEEVVPLNGGADGAGQRDPA